MNIKTATFTDRGGRANNDDTVRVLKEKGCTWVFVGDGLGGYAGGQQASEEAAESMLISARQGEMLSDTGLVEAVGQANQAVFQVQKTRQGKMKTTLVFLTIENGLARWTHVGDSRLYRFRAGKLCSQTMDHSVSQMAVLMGEITPREIRFHEDRNRVLRALGSESARPEVSPLLTLENGDAFLLCTDGFWEYVYEEEMEQTLLLAKNPQDWIDRMLAILHTRTPANNDNLTAAAVFCEA